ncbi:cell division protein FtsZ [Criibacterium bergeronii]|uniref:Cell division protein FtsZ n=1 Tax=Criibacterium bergeronii TaxID=1871336 RepID=A0A552V8Q8_9FIRM|nr:cell division protein FtsZ [Criibacterium bergeronii]MBS6062577.1 cell division protein FtsZ [Peptostreptococcaceae bacterium]TRW26857.1 cell division protein FtsZ [Criibacterium bergeronii]
MELAQDIKDESAKILIIGVGGGGGNAVNRMIEDDIKGVEYIVANTDNQALHNSKCDNVLQLGEKLTRGLGAGSKPEVGKKAAEETAELIKEQVSKFDMVFVTAGMGGGTGTGAAPVVASIAKEAGALTVGVITLPFQFEGRNKHKVAIEGLEELKKNVDSIMVIPNDKILEICPKGTSLADAFKKGNEVLAKTVKSITDLITSNGLINLDFADIRTVMENKGVCHVGFGTAKGENRAIEAAKQAITSPLLETSIERATDILVNVAATKDSFTIEEFGLIGDFIRDAMGENDEHESDHVITGSSYSDELGDELSLVIIATGIDSVIKRKTVNVDDIKTGVVNRITRPSLDDLDIDLDLNDDNSKNTIQNIDEVKEKNAKVSLEIPDFLKKNRRK